MFQFLLFLGHLFSCEASNNPIYDLLIVLERSGIEPYKSNIYFNDPMTVKEVKAVIRRNEQITVTIDKIQMFREGMAQEMLDTEMLGKQDKGSRSLIIKVPPAF